MNINKKYALALILLITFLAFFIIFKYHRATLSQADTLRAWGLNVTDTGETTTLASAKGTRLMLDNERMDAYQFKNAEAADAFAAIISPSGYNVGGTIHEWTAPHFYKKENIITLYVGSNENIQKKLEAAFGKQFAGIETRHACSPESRKADVCIELYQPVCGWFDSAKIQCVKYPCAQTFSNRCFACQNANILFWTEGECPK